MKNVWKTMAVAVPLAFLAACTDGAKAPAEAAMTAAGAAMDSLKGDAAKYAPEDVKKLQSTYGVARDSMTNKDYQGALTFAKDIPAKAKEVLAKADAAKAELAKAWKEAGDGMTKTIEAAKHRLSGPKKPPAGLDKATLAKAHADLTSLEAGWTAATEQYKSGDWSGAVAKAKDLNARGQELLKVLGTK
jgi:hypothetical protein